MENFQMYCSHGTRNGLLRLFQNRLKAVFTISCYQTIIAVMLVVLCSFPVRAESLESKISSKEAKGLIQSLDLEDSHYSYASKKDITRFSEAMWNFLNEETVDKTRKAKTILNDLGKEWSQKEYKLDYTAGSFRALLFNVQLWKKSVNDNRITLHSIKLGIDIGKGISVLSKKEPTTKQSLYKIKQKIGVTLLQNSKKHEFYYLSLGLLPNEVSPVYQHISFSGNMVNFMEWGVTRNGFDIVQRVKIIPKQKISSLPLTNDKAMIYEPSKQKHVTGVILIYGSKLAEKLSLVLPWLRELIINRTVHLIIMETGGFKAVNQIRNLLLESRLFKDKSVLNQNPPWILSVSPTQPSLQNSLDVTLIATNSKRKLRWAKLDRLTPSISNRITHFLKALMKAG
ncbi:MAG: hypothetical protein HQL69_02595 [Magnetococcales bacterium]|nr:hypothetical protein [Magnetococcales bacterium]